MPGQIRLTNPLGSFLPNKSIVTAPAAGKRGISQMSSRKFIALPFHQIDFVGVDRFLVAEQRNDDAKAYSRFRRRVDDYEDRKGLSAHRLELVRESHQVDVDGIQDQLNGDQND